MSGPYHVHEGKAFQSEGFLDRAKAFAKGTSTKGTFPVAKFLTEGKMSFKTTNFASKDIEGMYKVFNAEDETSTFYRIKIKNLGSENMYSEQFKSMKETVFRKADNTAAPDRFSDDREEDY